MNLIKLLKAIKSKINVIDKDFECERCGHCCFYTIMLTKEDISRIKANGYSNFTDGKTMDKTEGHCVFMNKRKNLANCKIHSIKPEICDNFPMFRRELCIRYSHPEKV
jgi:Fe-S-cluster containining protein